jgi:DNA repair exonuclease SbcCD ATPase subunit
LNTIENEELSKIEQEQMEVLTQISIREEEDRKKIEDEEERIFREVLELSRKENEEEIKKHEISEKEKILLERENKLKDEEERLKKKKKKLSKKKKEIKEFESKMTEKANVEQAMSENSHTEVQKTEPVISPEVKAAPLKVPVTEKHKKIKHTIIAQNVEKKPEPAVADTVNLTNTNGSVSASKSKLNFVEFKIPLIAFA